MYTKRMKNSFLYICVRMEESNRDPGHGIFVNIIQNILTYT